MLKTSFHVINILLIIFYLYPGSILGCYFYNDCNIQPSLTKDFIISSNHFFVFLIFGLIAFIAFSKEKKIIMVYVFFISIFLEIMHFFIPIRAFEIKDWNKLHLQIIFWGREFCQARSCYALECEICKKINPKRKRRFVHKRP